MLQAHSFLWNYLWVAPNIFLLALAIILWAKSLSRHVRTFIVFAVFSALGELASFAADVAPSVSAENFWRVSAVSLIIESLLKFLVIGEICSIVFSQYSSISRISRILISGVGGILVLVSGLIAGFGHGDSNTFLISGVHLLEQTVFIIETGLILCLILFAAYFHLSWDRLSLGILLGFGISSCEHLATWAVIANASPSETTRTLFAFLNMGAYHVCVLIWFYYVLVPGKVVSRSTVTLPENNLAVWNRELERLLQQ